MSIGADADCVFVEFFFVNDKTINFSKVASVVFVNNFLTWMLNVLLINCLHDRKRYHLLLEEKSDKGFYL